ncbi:MULTISPECIES: DUF4232 domain-containing protein [Streptomyces]|uniref:DUF4232 domain-containing protein n=1 Tax=Streptomyces TaxID=1883 RepID=UPI00123CF88F|nr:DUF4232 domain-containing protein [Streptomyces galilaeus]QEU67319.1 DUF4232 domain-containing protein [Streptomyces galilaeus]GGW44917.1 hypothetical protein GCM10010350_31030 [Streptomyces galilaeus]
MRAVPITVTALAAAFLLTACGGGDDSASGDGESKASAASGTACAAGDLTMAAGAVNAAPAAGDTGNVTVTVTNGGKACTLDGFPKVELEADGTTVAVPHDEGAQAQPLPLAEQGGASFTITYVRGEEGGSSLAVKTVSYGLPDASATESLDWSYGAVALKDGDKPDASVSAFQVAGD